MRETIQQGQRQVLIAEDLRPVGELKIGGDDQAHAGVVRDVKDIPVALAANQAGVGCLMSTNRDFTDEDETTLELRKRLTPMRVGSFLREVMRWRSEDLSAIKHRRWSDLEGPYWQEER